MKLFIFILLSFCFLNSHLVYATDLSLDSNQEQAHMLEQAHKSVWKIEDFLGEASGFFISPNEFVTNFHVVADLLKNNSNDFTLSQKDIHKTLKIKRPKHLSPHFDLAVLEIEGEVSDYLNLAEKDPELKENLSLIGYPKGEFKIVDKTYDISYENKFEYTYAVKHDDYRGASGAPVLNKKGEVAGVFYSFNKNQISVVKIIHLKNLLKQDSPSFENPKDHLEHSIKELRQVAESGDMMAQYRFGVMYAEGLGVEQDIKEAVIWFRKAAGQGYAIAQNSLGIYLDKLGVQEGFKEAVLWFRKAAEQGHAPAQFNLGVMYTTGQGVEQDLKEEIRWYRKAADQGYVDAQFNLGVMYEEGLGVEKDLEEAARWYRKAAEQEHPEAQNILGDMYEKGRGVEEDLKEAARWYREAAKQGHAEAQFNLGFAYIEGWGVEKDLEEAARWYKEAAEQEYAPAQFNLGVMYEEGLGVKKDLKEAARWFREAAEQGYAPAQFQVGVMYVRWQEEEDPEEAARWYKKAAEQGYVRAQFNLGVMYTNGWGVKADLEEAAYWFREAAEQGHAKAQFNLGIMYLRGQGVEQDLKEAACLYRKAAEQFGWYVRNRTRCGKRF